jgi:hypothetical protein
VLERREDVTKGMGAGVEARDASLEGR